MTLPYIVRVERGTVNRGIYDIAVLFDPTAAAWTATAPQRQWNRKVQVACDYPDSITTSMEVADCVLLVNFYTSPQWAALAANLTQAQIVAKKAAINGHLDQFGCHSWNNAFGNANKPGNYVPRLVINASGDIAPLGAPRNNCELPAAVVYDAATNPAGIRCTDPDVAVSSATPMRGSCRSRRLDRSPADRASRTS